VKELAELIELKLRANEHKQLEGVSSHFLYKKLMEEVHELFEANEKVHENTWYVPNEETEALGRALALEAADVAAVAGFFAARIKALPDPGHRDEDS
jgi:NTP pyrophosphatase (non-canonical NTP hydrolase)